MFQATTIASTKALGCTSFVERNPETLAPTLMLICDYSHPLSTLPTGRGSDSHVSESVTGKLPLTEVGFLMPILEIRMLSLRTDMGWLSPMWS